MRRPIPLVAACASFACFGAAGLAAADGDKDTDEPSAIGTVKPDQADNDEAKDYWTPERMRNAKPLPAPVLDPDTKKPVDED